VSSLAPPPLSPGGPPPGAPPPSLGAPPGGPPGGGTPPLLNSQDSLKARARGRIGPNSTVREGLEMMGIDVDGPISQLSALKGQVAAASTEGKIQSAVSSQPPGGPPLGAPPGAPPGAGPPPGGGGLGSLLGGR
jgi:hypothetical protein